MWAPLVQSDSDPLRLANFFSIGLIWMWSPPTGEGITDHHSSLSQSHFTNPIRSPAQTPLPMAMANPPPLLLVVVLVLAAFPSHPKALGLESPPVPVAASSSSSQFDAALATLQKQITYNFSAPDLLRRALTHASYSRENGRALAVLGLAAAQAAAALRALHADHDAAASAVARRARDASGEAACAAAGALVGIPAIVRVAAGTSASAAPVVCGALRALVGAVAVDAGSTDAAGEVFWRLHVLTAASATAAM